jgi:hypothetical protein
MSCLESWWERVANSRVIRIKSKIVTWQISLSSRSNGDVKSSSGWNGWARATCMKLLA